MIHISHKCQSDKTRHHGNPARALVFGFAALIIIGTLLLESPLTTRTGLGRLTFMEALFTATSAVCVTGLSVFDAGSTLTLYGQIVLICLIQVGGLGFMTLTSFFFASTRRHFSLEGEVLLRESLGETGFSGLMKLTVRIVTLTLVCEGIGALVSMISFIPHYGVTRGIFISIFHAISSFCNAGFDILGNGNNLIPYVEDPLINIVTMVLIVFGGLGFFVIFECWDKLKQIIVKWFDRKKRDEWMAPLSLHSRLVLVLSGSLVVIGFVIFLIAEGTNPTTLGAPGDTLQKKIGGALFQSVSTRTAGFMTIDQNDMRGVSKIATVIFMFIGASPGGIGGGIKTTTAAIVGAFVAAILRGRTEVNIWHKRMATQLVYRAVATFTIGFVVVVIVAAAISVIQPELELGDIIFETTSAFSTAGLSVGITKYLEMPSQLLLIFTMLGGRVGFFTLTVGLMVRMSGPDPDIRYPVGKVIIG